MPGRPVGNKFTLLKFKLIKDNNKYYALCLICNKQLTNSAESRLRSHRNNCVIENFDSESISSDGSPDPGSKVCNSKKHAAAVIKSEGDITSPFVNDDNVETVEAEVFAEETLNNNSVVNDTYDSNSNTLLLTPSTSALSEGPGTRKNEIVSAVKIFKRKPRKITKFIDKLSSTEETIINDALAEFFFGCNVPFTAIDSIHFKEFINKLRPVFTNRIPSRKTLSTTLLDKTYERIIKDSSNSLRSESVCIIDGWKNSTTNTKTVVCVVHNVDGNQAFLNAWDLSGTSETRKKLSDIISESINIAKEVYNTTIYGIVSDNASLMIKMGQLTSRVIWHSTCNSHTANLLFKDVIDKTLTTNVTFILKEFKHCDLEKLIVETGGHRLKLPCETRWCTYRDAYLSLLENLVYMKHIVAVEDMCHKKIKEEVKQLISDDEFIGRVKDYVEMLNPICELINMFQKSECSIADATHLWLNLKLPLKFQKDFNSKLESRTKMALNIYALSAFYLHPFYSKSKITSEQNKDINRFLLQNLDHEGINDLDNFRSRMGIFKVLFEKNIKKPNVFWRMAEMEHPNLSKLALKLLQMPASSVQIERAFSNWGNIHTPIRNRLTFERSKKLLHIYYSLKIKSKQYNSSNNWEEEDDAVNSNEN